MRSQISPTFLVEKFFLYCDPFQYFEYVKEKLESTYLTVGTVTFLLESGLWGELVRVKVCEDAQFAKMILLLRIFAFKEQCPSQLPVLYTQDSGQCPGLPEQILWKCRVEHCSCFADMSYCT